MISSSNRRFKFIRFGYLVVVRSESIRICTNNRALSFATMCACDNTRTKYKNGVFAFRFVQLFCATGPRLDIRPESDEPYKGILNSPSKRFDVK